VTWKGWLALIGLGIMAGLAVTMVGVLVWIYR
jgi:hypothetical protein